MKKLLILIFSFLLLSSPSVSADDISDFQIEGISIGDSLLDYMSEDEILKGIEETKDYYYYLKEPNKYAEVYLFNFSSTYEAGLSFIFENNSRNQYISNKNEKYKILQIRGMKNYFNDFDSCIQKRDKVAEELSNMFPNTQTIEHKNSTHPIDPSGNSIVNNRYFVFDSGAVIQMTCIDFEETLRLKNNWSEGLDIIISTEEVQSWLGNY